MLLEILKRMPAWVFVLFAALVFFGVMQSRTRQVTLVRVTILPLVLIGLSLSGLSGTFGGKGNTGFALAAWLAAVAATVLINRHAKWPRNVVYTAASRTFLVEGGSFAYRLISGAFLARALRILGAARAAGLPS